MTRVDLISLLEANGMRLTRTRLAVAQLLFFDHQNRHVSAEWVARELDAAGERISLATVYNTLNSFVEVGLLRQIQSVGSSVVFDTNTKPHHHFLRESTGELIDMPEESVSFSRLPDAPEGMMVKGVDLIVRID